MQLQHATPTDTLYRYANTRVMAFSAHRSPGANTEQYKADRPPPVGRSDPEREREREFEFGSDLIVIYSTPVYSVFHHTFAWWRLSVFHLSVCGEDLSVFHLPVCGDDFLYSTYLYLVKKFCMPPTYTWWRRICTSISLCSKPLIPPDGWRRLISWPWQPFINCTRSHQT